MWHRGPRDRPLKQVPPPELATGVPVRETHSRHRGWRRHRQVPRPRGWCWAGRVLGPPNPLDDLSKEATMLPRERERLKLRNTRHRTNGACAPRAAGARRDEWPRLIHARPHERPSRDRASLLLPGSRQRAAAEAPTRSFQHLRHK